MRRVCAVVLASGVLAGAVAGCGRDDKAEIVTPPFMTPSVSDEPAPSESAASLPAVPAPTPSTSTSATPSATPSVPATGRAAMPPRLVLPAPAPRPGGQAVVPARPRHRPPTRPRPRPAVSSTASPTPGASPSDLVAPPLSLPGLPAPEGNAPVATAGLRDRLLTAADLPAGYLPTTLPATPLIRATGCPPSARGPALATDTVSYRAGASGPFVTESVARPDAATAQGLLADLRALAACAGWTTRDPLRGLTLHITQRPLTAPHLGDEAVAYEQTVTPATLPIRMSVQVVAVRVDQTVIWLRSARMGPPDRTGVDATAVAAVRRLTKPPTPTTTPTTTATATATATTTATATASPSAAPAPVRPQPIQPQPLPPGRRAP